MTELEQLALARDPKASLGTGAYVAEKRLADKFREGAVIGHHESNAEGRYLFVLTQESAEELARVAIDFFAKHYNR